jgi:excinuclease ABC subunit C
VTIAHLDELRQQARALPELPGVYFWRDGRGKILYIGKAVNLRARVTSYFSTARHESRIRKLLTQSRTIDHEVAPNELEALFRESALIKRELPPYNRALRVARKLYFLKLDAATEHPYVEIVRETADDGSLYFGPFRTATIARETVKFIHDVLPLRKCSKVRPRCAPCLYHHMDTCAAPFLGDRYRERHEQAIEHLFDLLDGRTDRVTAWLEGKRGRLAESLLFERAAEIQQRLDTLRDFMRRQTILDAAIQCRCVLIYCPADSHGDARLLLVAHGNVVSMLSAAGAEVSSVLAWLKAHDPVISALRCRESELDAASVLERWLAQQRERVRWVSVPKDSDGDDLRTRVDYVIGQESKPALIAEPAATSDPPTAVGVRDEARG